MLLGFDWLLTTTSVLYWDLYILFAYCHIGLKTAAAGLVKLLLCWMISTSSNRQGQAKCFSPLMGQVIVQKTVSVRKRLKQVSTRKKLPNMVTSHQWNQQAEQLLRSLCCRHNTAPLRNWEFLKQRKITQTKCSKLSKCINILKWFDFNLCGDGEPMEIGNAIPLYRVSNSI